MISSTVRRDAAADPAESQVEPPAQLKILAISHMPNDENAGASRIYHLLARGLRERGHTVKLLHYEDLKIPAAARATWASESRCRN